MTVIFQGNQFWIEYLEFPTEALGAGAVYTQTLNLERPGNFIGACAMVRSVTVEFDVSTPMIDSTAGTLVLGLAITDLRVRAVTVTAQTVSMNALVFMRKN